MIAISGIIPPLCQDLARGATVIRGIFFAELGKIRFLKLESAKFFYAYKLVAYSGTKWHVFRVLQCHKMSQIQL